jgi:hypothetical protein
MGTADFLFAKNAGAIKSAKAERARADGAVRRCAELRAENAKLKHDNRTLRESLHALRVELATLRKCINPG